MVTLAPNRSQLSAFAAVLFKYAEPGTYVSLRAFKPGGSGGPWHFKEWRWIKLNGSRRRQLIDAATALAAKCAASTDRPVFCPPIATFKTRTDGATRANLANGLVLSVECDTAAQEGWERLAGIIGPCTAVVASGGRWEDEIGLDRDKLHLHWRLDGPTRTPAEHNALREARQLATLLTRADASNISVVHPIRWPGSWHLKSKPRLAMVVDLQPNVEINLGDALLRLREAASALDLKPDVERKPNPKLVGDIRIVRSASAELINDWNVDWTEWNRIGMAHWAATAGSEEGEALFHAYSAKNEVMYDYGLTEERWEHFATSPPNGIGAGTLVYEARKANPNWKKLDVSVSDAAEIEIRSGSSYKMRKTEWAWKDYLAYGKFHIVAGDKGAGKSTLDFDWAATITVGGVWPDGTQAPLGDIFIWSSEDDIEDTILPRIAAAGGDVNRVHFAGSVKDENGKGRRFNPATDMPALMEALKKYPEMRLMIIDPVVMASKADSHKNAETRIGLQPLIDLAEERRVVLIGITHFTKNSGGRNPIDGITGTLAYGAMARIAYAVVMGKGNEPRKLVRIASNIGPDGGGFEYTLSQAAVPGHDFEAQVVRWGNQLVGSPIELLESDPDKVIAMRMLREVLIPAGDEGIPVKQLEEMADAHSISLADLKKASKTLGCIRAAQIEGAGKHAGWKWVWVDLTKQESDDSHGFDNSDI